MESSIERNDGISSSHDAEVSCQPLGAVGGQDGAPSAVCDPVLVKPIANGFGHAPELDVGVALHAIGGRTLSLCTRGRGVLHLYCDRVGEAADSLQEPAVEHVVCRILQDESG